MKQFILNLAIAIITIIVTGCNKDTEPKLELTEPKLGVSHSAFTFFKEGSEEQLELQLIISNTGVEQLDWNISNKPDWLLISKISGRITTISDTLILSAMINNLNYGVYKDEFQIESNGGNKKIHAEMKCVPKHKMTVMTYNILVGAGVDTAYQESNRLTEILEVIQRLNPDILGIQEATSWDFDNEATAKQVARRLNMNYYLGESASDMPVVIYTKYTIIDTLSYKNDFSRAAQWIRIVNPENDTLSVFNVHLHSTSESIWAQELTSLVNAVKPHKNDLTIVMGDFNGNPELLEAEGFRLATYGKMTTTWGNILPGKQMGDRIYVPAPYIFINHFDAADRVSFGLLGGASDHVPGIIQMGVSN